MPGQPLVLTTVAVPHTPIATSRVDANTALGFAAIALLLPVLLSCISIAQRRRRQTIMQKRIAILERLWLLTLK
jgi:hypothetical protein